MSDNSNDKLAGARSQAMAQYASIGEMVARLRAADDDDALAEIAQELGAEAGFTVSQDAEGGFAWVPPKSADADEARYATEGDAWLACCQDNDLRPDSDRARQTIEEDALSVEVRSGWCSPGSEMKAEEFCILLCTGGPAVRIRGELNEYGEPDRAWLECQDWFTPWTQVFDVEQETLLAYARCFYFGEG
jgi:hypothetical protein